MKFFRFVVIFFFPTALILYLFYNRYIFIGTSKPAQTTVIKVFAKRGLVFLILNGMVVKYFLSDNQIFAIKYYFTVIDLFQFYHSCPEKYVGRYLFTFIYFKVTSTECNYHVVTDTVWYVLRQDYILSINSVNSIKVTNSI